MKWADSPKYRQGWPSSLVAYSDMSGDNNKRVLPAETLHESTPHIERLQEGTSKAPKKVRMYFLLVLVMTVHGKIEGKNSNHLIDIKREFRDFESDIVDQKSIMMRKGGKGLKEFWCDLYKYR